MQCLTGSQTVGLLLALSVLVALPVRAQITANMTCQSQYAWLDNSQNQTPCLISATLSAQCNNGLWNVPPVATAGIYTAPSGASANICRCNTVLYNLLQGCSICQGGAYGNWSDWKANCAPNAVYIQQYPLSLPSGLHIPGWAFLNPVPTNHFDINTANAVKNQPEAIGASAVTSTGTQVTGTQIPTTTGTQLPGKANNNNGGGGGSSTNVGAIVGGVVGGLALIALAAGLVLFLMRRNKRKKSATTKMNDQSIGGGYTAVSPSDHGMAAYSGNGHMSMAQPMKPYNPEDPSTFPITPAPPSTTYADPYQSVTAPTGSAYNNNATYAGAGGYPQYPQTHPGAYGQPLPQHQPTPGAYTGAAEL